MIREHVLLVDDDEEYLEAMAERMEARGLHVTVARNGEEALQAVTEKTFDVVFLDLQMPGIDGIETLHRLREREAELQVILITGYGTIDSSVAAMKLGAKDFVQKPADIESLVEKAKEARADRLLLVEARNEELIREILAKRAW
jgi:DNA-binding NtrC family response regulator